MSIGTDLSSDTKNIEYFEHVLVLKSDNDFSWKKTHLWLSCHFSFQPFSVYKNTTTKSIFFFFSHIT